MQLLEIMAKVAREAGEPDSLVKKKMAAIRRLPPELREPFEVEIAPEKVDSEMKVQRVEYQKAQIRKGGGNN